MSKKMREINNQLDTIQTNLLNQLERDKIEFIDLQTYANIVNNLKIAKNNLYLNSLFDE